MPNMGSLKASIAAALDKQSFKEAGLEARKLVGEQIKVAIETDDTKALRKAATTKRALDAIFDKDIRQKVDVDTSSLGSKLKAVKSLLTGEMDTAGKSAGVKIGAGITGGLSKALSGIGGAALKSGGILAAVTTVGHMIPPILAAAGVLAGGALAVGIGGALIVGVVKLNPKVSAAAKNLGSAFTKAFVAASNSGGKSSFASTLINSFNKLRTQAIPPLQSALKTLFAAFNNSGAIQTITNKIIALSRWLGNGGMGGSIKLAVGVFKSLQSEAGKAAGPLSSLGHAFTVLWPAIKAVWSIGNAVSSTLAKAFLPAIAKLLPSLSRLAATVANAGAQLAKDLGPAIQFVAQTMGPIISDISNWLSKNPALVKGILAAALAWKALNLVMDANPYVLIIAATILLAGVIVRYHTQIKNAIVAAWQAVDRDAIQPVVSWFVNTIPHAFGISLNAVESVLLAIKGAFVASWHAIYSTTTSIFSAISKFFGGFWAGLKGGFHDVVSGITSTWDKLKTAFESPIKFAVDTVYNKGVVPLWNDTLAHLGLPQAKTLNLGFATGGMVDGPGTGISDSIPIQASRGEYIVKAPAVRKIGIRALDALNGNSNSSHGHYSGGGGILGGIESAWDNTGGKAVSAVANAGKSLLDKVESLGGKALSDVLTPLINTIPHNISVGPSSSGSGNDFGNIAYDFGKKLVSSISAAGDAAQSKGGGTPGIPGGVVSGSAYQNLLTIAKYLVSQGATKAAGAGIASVVDGESGGNPEAVGSGGFGLIGWTGNTIGLPKGYKGPTGKESYDLAVQMAGIVGYGKANGPWGTLIKQTDPNAAADMWSSVFERPLVHLSDTRPSVAAQLFAALGGTGGVKQSTKAGSGGQRAVGFFGGGVAHAGVPSADRYMVNVSDGEKIIPRAQAQSQDNVSGPTTEQLLSLAIQHLKSIAASNSRIDQSTQNTASAVGGIQRVRRLH